MRGIGWMLAGGLLGVIAHAYVSDTLFVKRTPSAVEHTAYRHQKSVLEEAVALRKSHDSVHIYMVNTNQYEVWCTGGLAGGGLWRATNTLEAARQIVDDYYVQWAKNCIGPTPPGKQVE